MHGRTTALPDDREQLNHLLCDLKRGNADALDEILRLAGGRMLALARGVVRNHADAEDVVQDSFWKIARGIKSYKDDTNGYAWIMRIVRNTALDLLRRRRMRAEEDIEEFFHLSDERYSADKRENAIVLEEAIKKLEPLHKKMIYYRYYLDFTVREIAKETGLSRSAIQRAVEAAEKELKFFLDAGQNGS